MIRLLMLPPCRWRFLRAFIAPLRLFSPFRFIFCFHHDTPLPHEMLSRCFHLLPPLFAAAITQPLMIFFRCFWWIYFSYLWLRLSWCFHFLSDIWHWWFSWLISALLFWCRHCADFSCLSWYAIWCRRFCLCSAKEAYYFFCHYASLDWLYWWAMLLFSMMPPIALLRRHYVAAMMLPWAVDTRHDAAMPRRLIFTLLRHYWCHYAMRHDVYLFYFVITPPDYYDIAAAYATHATPIRRCRFRHTLPHAFDAVYLALFR